MGTMILKPVLPHKIRTLSCRGTIMYSSLRSRNCWSNV